MMRFLAALFLVLLVFASGSAEAASDAVKAVTIRAGRDMGYFAGDMVKVSVQIVVAGGFELERASLPHPGPINYWLDLRSIDVTRRAGTDDASVYTLAIAYQNFYDALDARQQEIPTFPVVFKKGQDAITADVPAWTIGVSPLREVSPPPKDDPKDYMRADVGAPAVATSGLWWSAAAALVAALLAAALLAYDKGVWPFHARPARAFNDVWRRLRTARSDPDTDARYLDALLLLHRGIDRTDGQRILADDLGGFLTRHPSFQPMRDGLSHFFAASRAAFFGSDPTRSRALMPFKALERLAGQLAAAERTQP